MLVRFGIQDDGESPWFSLYGADEYEESVDLDPEVVQGWLVARDAYNRAKDEMVAVMKKHGLYDVG